MSRRSSFRMHLVDGPRSVGERFRSRRWDRLNDRFPDLDRMSVLDLGGTPRAWLRAPVVPKAVTVLNLSPRELELVDGASSLPSWIDVRAGDACDPPGDILDRQWDLVLCNSLIEHVGGYARRRELAAVIRGLGSAYWVQTPYRYFPLEPHFLFPMFQFLPLAVRRWILLMWPMVHTRPETSQDALSVALETELIGRAEMRHLFPGGDVIAERVGPIPKSLIAIKGPLG